MRDYYEAGTGFNFKVEDKFPKLSNQQKEEIGKHWQQVSRGSTMFPGGVWCAHSVNTGPGRELNIEVNRSDYAVYKYTRDNGLEIPGTYSIGVGTLVYDEEKEAYVFAERSGEVGFDKRKISMFGGVVDWDNTQREPKEVKEVDFMEMIREQAQKELGEELKVDKNGRMGAPTLIGAYVDEGTLKVEFAFVVTARGIKLSGDKENTKLIYVKTTDLPNFFNQNRERMEGSTIGHLEYWTKVMLKQS